MKIAAFLTVGSMLHALSVRRSFERLNGIPPSIRYVFFYLRTAYGEGNIVYARAEC